MKVNSINNSGPMHNTRIIFTEIKKLTQEGDCVTISDLKSKVPFNVTSLRKHFHRLVDLGCLRREDYMGSFKKIAHKYFFVKDMED